MAADLNGIPQALADLEEELIRRASNVRQALRPGLSATLLEEILRPFPHAVPDQLRQLYRWHDGTEVVRGWRALLFPGARWLPLREAVKTWGEAQEGDRITGQAAWDSRWLPVFTDGSDGFHVVACGDGGGEVLTFFFVGLPATWSEFSDLHSLVEALVQRWRSGAYWQGVDGEIQEDRRAVAAIRRATDGKPPDFDQLLAAIDQGSVETYAHGLGLLRSRLYPEAVPGLLRLLQAGSDQGRRAAAELLGSVGDPAAAEPLRSVATTDRDQIVRMLARNALMELDAPKGGESR